MARLWVLHGPSTLERAASPSKWPPGAATEIAFVPRFV
jgi:hypothetical protein